MVDDQKIQLHTVATLKEWLIKQKEALSLKDKAIIDTLLINAKWEQGVQRLASNGKQLIFIPMTNFKVGLEFFYDKNSKVIDSGNIVKVTNYRFGDTTSPIVAIQTYYETSVLKRQASTQYTGTIITYSIVKNFLYDFSFSNGIVITRGFLAQSGKSEDAKARLASVRARLNGILCEPWGHFTVWFPSGDITLDYVYLRCSCENTTSIDIRTGQQIRVNCVDDGGTPADPGPVVRLWNNLSNPCLKNLLNRVMSRVNSITNMLAITYAPGSRYAFNYGQSVSLPDTVMGQTTAPMQGSENMWWANIVLNANKLPGSSEEFTAGTILHEAIHAFILANTQVANELAHHSYMADRLVYEISTALKSMFPNMDPVHATALAWQGLTDNEIAGWRALPQNTKNFFEQIIIQYSWWGWSGTRNSSCQ